MLFKYWMWMIMDAYASDFHLNAFIGPKALKKSPPNRVSIDEQMFPFQFFEQSTSQMLSTPSSINSSSCWWDNRVLSHLHLSWQNFPYMKYSFGKCLWQPIRIHLIAKWHNIGRENVLPSTSHPCVLFKIQGMTLLISPINIILVSSAQGYDICDIWLRYIYRKVQYNWYIVDIVSEFDLRTEGDFRERITKFHNDCND